MSAVAYLEPEADPSTVGTVELVRRAGITFRMADYWTRTGLINETPRARSKSGFNRTYPAGEVPVAALIGLLSAGGVHIRVAEPAARELLATGHTTLAGIRLELPEAL